MSNTVSTRNIAADIVERFEAILDEHDINIPDDLREGGVNEASLYGETYSNLLDEVEEILYSALNVVKNNPDLEIAKGVFY